MHFTMFTQFNAMVRQIGLEATADFAASIGFSAVEPQENSIPVVTADRSAAEVKKVLAERGLTVSCCSIPVNLYKSPESEEYLMKQAEIIADLGCPYLHHTLLTNLVMTPDLPAFDEAMEVLVDAATRVARYAAKLGVTCLYEDQGLYANGVEQFGVFWREISNRCSNIGVCGDMGNTQFVDEGAAAFFRAYAPYIRHVHAKDYLRKSTPVSPGMYWMSTRGGSFVRDTTMGSGIVEIDECMQILKDTGYTGSYSLELCHPEPFEPGVKQAMDYLRRFV